MFPVIGFLLTIFFLLGTFFLTALTTAFRSIHRRDSQKEIVRAGKYFFYRPFHSYFFHSHEYEGVFFSAICAQNIARCCYACSATLFLLATPLFDLNNTGTGHLNYDLSTIFWIILSAIAILLLSFIVGEYLPRILGMRMPGKMIRSAAPFSSIFMFLVFPITYIFLKITYLFSRNIQFDHLYKGHGTEAKREIIDIIQDAQLSPDMNRQDKKLIESVLSFRNRIAREVMVPRVDVFSLPETTSIKDAAALIASEGYSRIPIYRNTIDEIVGVLMYKDVLVKFREFTEKGMDESILEAPIESIQKSVLYTPETKKISNLLQEFRKKQVHLAIVVDEYGGTEGIVTIEDILEEIVGDISDEYDVDEVQFTEQPDGNWIIDARMSIFDVEELLEITIPQEGDYETIGGYVFHCAGTIPSKGFTIHNDAFELEVLKSNERFVEQVRIKCHPNQNNQSSHQESDSE